MINYGDFPGSQLTSTEIPMPEITKGVNLFVVDQENNAEAAIQEALKTPVRVTVGRLSVKVALMNQLNQDLVQGNVAKGASACSLTGWQFSVVISPIWLIRQLFLTWMVLRLLQITVVIVRTVISTLLLILKLSSSS